MTLYKQAEIVEGMKLLDEKFPGWRAKILLEDLDLSSPWRCILGQTTNNSYARGVEALEITDEQAAGYGFILLEGQREGTQYDRLTWAWKQLIQGKENEPLFNEEEVRKGAAFLDEHRPGWEKKIRVDHLDMSQWNRCIIGQLEGDFEPGLEKYGLAPHEASSHGFMLDVYIVDNYVALGETWIAVIGERLA